jgi:hypothetical protein
VIVAAAISDAIKTVAAFFQAALPNLGLFMVNSSRYN